MHSKRAVITLTIIVCVLPFAVQALTLDEIKVEFLGLLERVSALKAKLEQAGQNTDKPKVFSQLPCLSLGRTLRFGMSGEDVQKLQELLIKGGFLAEGKSTGYFGPLTEAAVKEWQTAAGIVSSGSAATTGFGVVGPRTRAAILTACKTQVSRAREAQARTCPVEPPAPSTSDCAGAWEKGYDAAGCLTGYQCVAASTTPATIASETPLSAPSITILEPTSLVVVTGGNALTIRWESSNVPVYGSVSLSLVDASGNIVGDIARNLAPSGIYLWRVPQGSTNCSAGENAFECIEKFARCEGGTSVCSLEPGTYAVHVALLDLESSSEPFQIAGTSITDLLQSVVGAPAVAPPSPMFAANATEPPGVNSCVHDGRAYAEGTTLSVPCSGNCPSPSPGSGTGFITGTCTGGLWCIPYTAYCASSFARIDVSAYEGGGAGKIKSGYASYCPQEGWRAYLACPFGGCVTGWNTCRGGVWVRDKEQSVVPVGTQGPCQADQLWCEIGTEHGFGCVLSSQCINGKALF